MENTRSLEELRNIRARTDAKLAYARIQLTVLQTQGGNGGTDFDRSFQESILFHLFGALDAFTIELNAYYSTGLPIVNLTRWAIQKILKNRGTSSPEIAEIYHLDENTSSWLSHARQMRDHSTHVSGVARDYHMGGENDRKVFLRNPTTGISVEFHATDALAQWLSEMEELLERLRASAIARSAT